MTLPADLEVALTTAAGRPRLLVATDFDGVVAPLVLDPMKSRPLPGTTEDLRALAALPDTYAAVVSGRDLDTLSTLTGLGDSAVTRIGSHGAQTSADGAARDLDEGQAAALEHLVGELASLAADHPGTALEHKPSAVVLHTRGMDADAAESAELAAYAMAEQHPDVKVMRGKRIVEMSVLHADKGTALLALRDDVAADAVVYFGDDVTDEDVFTALGPRDVGVKVGDGPTAAAYRVAGPEDAAAALAFITRRRAG